MNRRITNPRRLNLLVLLAAVLPTSAAIAGHAETHSLAEAKQLATQSGSTILVETYSVY